MLRGLSAALAALVGALAASPDAASICLAYYDAARIVVRALRSRRCASDSDARLHVLAAAVSLARTDDAARSDLLSHGVLATVAQCVEVR